ncbi:hypothetical protein AB0H76_29685 [Nocardia sp. NPDC050712]|uniref:hypothetical protein n=1 Tax=Nocardia sp. NPDC050712 TaxID=3155518 RepID=UPI0033D8B805
MPEEIAGKIFHAPGEDTGHPEMSEEERAAILAQFDAWNADKASLPPRNPEPRTEENRKFWDDLSGTEYEEWQEQRRKD